MSNLRPYQREAFEAAIKWIEKCVDPCLIEAATGAGKSHIIAAIANKIHEMSGKSILCLAPSAELVEQNRFKYLETGNPASIFSASVGRKEMHHPVVFGTPGTVSNSVRKFGKNFAAIVVDEAHGVTPTLMRIIDHVRSQNPLVRVVGLSASPYRLGSGYIYANDHRGPVDEAVEPFFHTKVFEIGARDLIEQGFLSPPVFDVPDEHYDTSGLKMKSNGEWDKATVEQAFVGRGRKTSLIVSNVVEKSRGRRGVMIFAATIQHAEEVMESLDPNNSRIITGGTPKAERAQIIDDFKAVKFKYLVNVAVLCTGFDAPHVDVVAILRATESVALLQQIIGRGLRICEGKDDVLILDYADNIERHCSGGDVFSPEIKARSATKGDGMQVACPLCNHTNTFGARKNDEGYDVDSEGYFTDLAGSRIEVAEGKPLPAHYGRRCQGEAIVAGKHVQCSHKWSFKECSECAHENDIAARYCTGCKAEIIDPNEKLKEIATKMANDPYRTRFAEVTGWQVRRWPSSKDNTDSLRVDYYFDENPTVVSEWYPSPDRDRWSASRWSTFCSRHWGRKLKDISEVIESYPVARPPTRVAYRKKPGSKFFNVITVD